MKFGSLTLALLLAVYGGVAFAHGKKVHIRGTVEKISADSLQVKTLEGKTVEVKVAASTVYLLHVTPKPAQPSDTTVENIDKPSKLADLAAGDLVVIHATPKGSNLEAEEIKFTVPSSSRSGSAVAQKPRQ